MPYERFSQDKQTNRTGRTLIDFCKVHDLLLLYGRAYQDKLVGKLTCKNAPTVDYVISSLVKMHQQLIMSFPRLTHYTFLQTLTLMIFVLCTQMCIVQLHLTCNTNSIGDEYQYLLLCNLFNNERKHFLPTINSSRNTSAFTFRCIMCETNETKLFKLCCFLKIVLNKVRSPPG